MTSVCVAGAASQPKAGVTEWASILGAAASLAVSSRGGGWMLALAAILQLPPIELAPFCAGEPPAMTTLTIDDIAALISPIGSTAKLTAATKLADNIKNILWYEFCECVSGTQPTPPAVGAEPSGTPDVTGPQYALPGPCATSDTSTTAFTNGSGLNRGGVSWIGKPGQWLRVVITQSIASGAGVGTTIQIQQQQQITGSVTNIHIDTITVTPTSVRELMLPIYTGADSLNCRVDGTSGSGSTNNQIHSEVYCFGSAPGAAPACCPPDAGVMLILQQLLELATLQQRGNLPFAYLLGTVHSGLSGNGELSVQGLLGLLVTVTTLPGRAGLVVGDPDSHFDIGWVAVGTDDGWMDSRRVRYTGQLWLPRDMSAMTLVGYSIPPDVVVDITEVTREP